MQEDDSQNVAGAEEGEETTENAISSTSPHCSIHHPPLTYRACAHSNENVSVCVCVLFLVCCVVIATDSREAWLHKLS